MGKKAKALAEVVVPDEVLPLRPPNGFIASAVRLPTASRRMAGRAEGWQHEAWTFFDTVGELRFVATWVGNVLSRAKLMAAHGQGQDLEPVEDGPAADAMHAFFGGPEGQSAFLYHQGVHLTVAGENYIVNRAMTDTWNVLASGKVTEKGRGQLQADFGTEGGAKPLASDDLVIRIWTPHPRDTTRADSPVRANLGTLAQIAGYDRHVAAQLQSRLTGGGILFISNEVEFPVPAGMDPSANQANIFMALLAEAMTTPINDPADPSAVVPIVAMVPTDSLGKNEHVKFWSDLDANVVQMRDAAIKRFALGMDVPPEIVLGLADANHWNAWLSEESAIKVHAEPRLEVINGAVTTQYLRPALTNQVPDPQNYYCIADTASIRLRPNRSREAVELYDRGELSGDALRRETGFQPKDGPDDAGVTTWLLRKMATGATSPELAQAAAKLLGTDLLGAMPNTPQQPADNTRTDTAPAIAVRTPPALEVGRMRADTDNAQGLSAACDVLVYRALERAGNRLKNMHPRTDTTMTAAINVYKSLSGEPDKLLAGAWDCAAEVLGPYTEDPATVVETLDFYVRGLLASHRPHSAVVLGALLRSVPVPLEPAGG